MSIVHFLKIQILEVKMSSCSPDLDLGRFKCQFLQATLDCLPPESARRVHGKELRKLPYLQYCQTDLPLKSNLLATTIKHVKANK